MDRVPDDGWRALVRRFCADELRPHAAEWARRGSVDRDLWCRAGRAGLLCPDGAAGGGPVDTISVGREIVVVDEQARAGDTAWGYTAHEIVARHVLEHGTDDQRARWLPGLASGELVGALAISEPDAGSDLAGVATEARPDGSELVLTGTKAFVTNGLLADLVVVLARTGDEFSAVVVDTRRTPVRRVAIAKIGRHGQDTAELAFAGCRVPADDLLGGVAGRGSAQMLPMMTRERVLIAVAAAAGIETVLSTAVRWCDERTVSGKPLRRLQNTRFVLAECATEAAACRAYVDDVARRLDGDGVGMAEAAAVKLWATERLAVVTDRCLQLYGGLGYTADNETARAWADARVGRIYGGTSEVMKELVAAGLGSSGSWR